MAGIFLKIINMSISASWLVLVVLLLRLLLKKAPKWINGILWGFVGLRLIMPFSFESIFSLIPSAETISKAPDAPRPHFDSGVTIVDNQVNNYLQGHYFEGVSRPAGHFVDITTILAIVWVVGIVGLLIYTVISYMRLKNKIGTAVLLRDNIFQSENVVSPFVLGIIKPKIYLPFKMNEQDMEHVIAHEEAHIRRKDHWWKPFGFLLLALHWFNPLMWLGYVLLCRDIELACDEKVIKDLNTEQKADYSQALLSCSVNRRVIAACPLAFGEVGVKNRVKSVLNYKKPAFWIIVIAILASLVVAVCFLTNPASNKLKNIENSSSIPTSEKTVVWVSDGATYQAIGTVGTDLLEELSEIKISRKEISLSRDENRDKSHTLVLQTKEDAAPTIHSYLKGLYIHFNADFTSVWVNDGVKPTFSYKVIDPKNAKAIYENIANYVGPEKLTWTYRPMTSFTGNYTKAFFFDFDYTHVEGTCTEGEFWSLDAEGQPRDTKMRFENGKTVYWTPTEAVIEKVPQKSEVTLAVYNDETQLHKCTVIFECVSRDTGSAEFEIYLKVPDGLRMLSYGEGIQLVEQNSTEYVGGPTNIGELKVKYPQFFNVSTDGGLKVYIWQMSKSNYQCYLVNRGIDMFADQSFAFEVGATIAEMRAILTTYDIDPKDITIHPVNNPLSSYYYEITDVYRAEVTELFWSENIVTQDALIGKPPAMTVRCGKSSVDAWLGTYSWMYKNFEDGTAQTTNADSSHPLTRIDEIPTLNILPTTMSAIDPRLATVQFAVAPDKIEVKCYKVDERNTNGGKAIPVEGTSFKLKDGKYLYEVIVEWTKSEQYSGKAHYAFQAVDADLEIVDINSVEKKITAHTTVDTQLYTNSNLTEKALNVPKGTNVYLIETDANKGAAKAVCGEYIGWIPSINLKLGKNNTQTSSTDNDLASAISSVLHEKYRATKPDGLIHIENYYLLANETASGTPLKGNSGHMQIANVYLLVYHMKYSINGDRIEEYEGDFVPTAITFTVDENGEYTLEDYWTPQTGANYEKDIRNKFPGSSATEALNTEKYAEDLIKESWRLATQYLNQIKSSSN